MLAVLRLIHRYLGLLLLLPIIVQGVTGAVLTFEPMLNDADATPAAAAQGSAPVSIDAILAAARAVAPEGTQATRYMPAHADGNAEVWFSPSGTAGRRGLMTVSVNTVTMAPVGPPEAKDGPLDWMRRLHTNFLLQDFGGRSIVGWVGVGLLLLSVIGIPIWWPANGRWREAFTISRMAKGMVFHRRLHGAVGIWVVAFLLVSSFTGAVLGFPQTVRLALGIQQQARPQAGPGGGGNRAPAEAAPPNLDAALALASTAVPGTALRMVFLPANPGGPIRMSFAPPGSEGVARMSMVTVDGKAARVVNVQGPNTISAAELSLRWAHDLHFGQGLGPVWRILTIVTGLALPLFAVTGFAMWLLRNLYRKRAGFARPDALSPGE